MFSGLTRLLDRNFVVGFFLPSILFFAANVLVFFPETLEHDDLIVDFGVGGLCAWLLAVSLMAANKRIIQIKEGYGAWAVFLPCLRRRQERRLARLESRLKRALGERRQLEVDGRPVPRRLKRSINTRVEQKVTGFPPAEDWELQPTAFGNVIRSFESYPQTMYGFAAVKGWNRLLPVLPKDARDEVACAKAPMDFFVNLWALSCLFFCETMWLLSPLNHPEPGLLWLPLASLASAWFASFWARRAAVDWGETIKACFDVFLPDLGKKLGWKEPEKRKDERRQWERFSRAIRYHQKSELPPLGRDTGADEESDVASTAAGTEPRVRSPRSGF